MGEKGFSKHGEILKFLKEQHQFTHGFANLVAHKSKGSDAGSVENKDDLVESQYKGKEHFRPIFESLKKEIDSWGSDIEFAPKNAYVSVRRKKQFCILQPATKSRFEIGVNLKGFQGEGKLQEITKANSMCSHKIDLTSESDLDTEVFDWLKKAYDNAG